MSIDKSLRRKNSLARARSVLTRDERIKTMKDSDKWTEGRSPYGLPKVRVVKITKKAAPKKEKAAEGEAAPAAGAPAKGGTPAAKPDAKKK